MIRILAIALLILLIIRALVRSMNPPARKSTGSKRDQSIYDDGDVVVKKKNSSDGAVEDVDFEEIKD